MRSATFVGANPQKTSRFGLKARAGGAVTFINTGMTRGHETSCTVLESLDATGAITISEHHGSVKISGLTESDITMVDKTRMRDPEKLQLEEEARGEAKKPKANGKTFTSVEAAKSGRAKCKECKETIQQGELRIGSAANFNGNPCTHWRKASCVTTITAGQIQNLDGFDALSENHKNQLLGIHASKPSAASKAVAMHSAAMHSLAQHEKLGEAAELEDALSEPKTVAKKASIVVD